MSGLGGLVKSAMSAKCGLSHTGKNTAAKQQDEYKRLNMSTKIKWFPPDKEPLCDALVVTKKGPKVWRSWDGAAPGNWFCWNRDYGIKKWRKIFKTEQNDVK